MRNVVLAAGIFCAAATGAYAQGEPSNSVCSVTAIRATPMQAYKQAGEERARLAGMTGGDQKYHLELLSAAKAQFAEKLPERVEAYNKVIQASCQPGQILSVTLPDTQGDVQGASSMSAIWCDFSKQIIISPLKDYFACVYAPRRRLDTHLVEMPK